MINAINACATGGSGGGGGVPGNTLAAKNFSNSIANTGIISGRQPISTDLSDLPIPVSSGGTGAASLTARGVMLGEGTSAVALVTLATDQFLAGVTGANPAPATIPNCLDSAGQHLNYSTSTHAFSCGTTGTGGGGSVTSVGTVFPANDDYAVAGSPVSTSGTMTFSHAAQTCSGATCAVTTGNIKCDATSNNVEVDLPASTSSFITYRVCKKDSSTHTCTVKPTGTTIDGAASLVLTLRYQCIAATDMGP